MNADLGHEKDPDQEMAASNVDLGNLDSIRY